jgi:hypothetical protein
MSVVECLAMRAIRKFNKLDKSISISLEDKNIKTDLEYKTTERLLSQKNSCYNMNIIISSAGSSTMIKVIVTKRINKPLRR